LSLQAISSIILATSWDSKQNTFSSQNKLNFKDLGEMSEDEKINIIKTGFRLKNDEKISFKQNYEGTEPYSLLQFRGYQIKYETIRLTKFYQNLKN
jgi:hypothetical protein